MSVSFRVYGHPAPQGSKVRTRWGMREDNPRTLPWREAIVGQIVRDGLGRTLLTVPVLVRATFLFTRPKSHYGTLKGQPYLKPNAPTYKTSDPDLDKLQRNLGDALVGGGVLRDDNVIVRWDTVKRYCSRDEREGVLVEVIPL